MQLAVATLDGRMGQCHACELCVLIMGRNVEASEQIIGICPDCQRDLPG